MVEKYGVEISSLSKAKGHFNPELFYRGLFNRMVQKFMVEKSGVEKFMVEKFMVEKSWIESSGLKLGVEKYGVEMSFNPLEVLFSPNQFLGLDFFCCFLQQTGSKVLLS